MTEPLVISIPHRLGRSEAKRRLDDGIGRLRPELARYVNTLDIEWQGDRLNFRARALMQTISGRLDVFEETIRLEIDLPWLLRLLAPTITRQIRGRGRELLEKPPER
ncbi:MAG TPA: polyhydroxyalkanoic acid system family protein [Stellaceae bacterium]|nr:polyhydroxyalkanoic acid system family protein [Stellaceae bacterium]